MPIRKVFAEIAVNDFRSAVSWYEQLLGRAADSTPMDGLAEWYIADGGGLQVFQDLDRAGATWVTLEMTALDDHLVELRAKGIAVGPASTANYVRIATVIDPDGNHLTFAEPLTDQS